MLRGELNLHNAKVSPTTFTANVLRNCGEIRNKGTKIIDTTRGTGFLRKFSQWETTLKDPVLTYYGADN